MRKNLLSRRLKYGSSSALFTLLCLVAIALVYLTSELLTARFGLSFDMTEGGIYEVSEQTRQYLGTLEDEIVMTVLADQNDYETLQGYAQINELIKKYVLLSNGKISVRYVNVYKNPSFLNDYPTTTALREGAVIIESGKRYKAYQIDDFYEFTTDEQFDETYISGNVAEQKLTSGIRFVTMDVLPQIVLVSGHNEGAMAGFDELISQNNYQVQTVNLLQDDIPEGSNLVILNAPQTDFTADEIDKLDRYLEKDGSAVLYLYSPNYGEHPVLERFAADWGVRKHHQLHFDDGAAGTPGAALGKPRVSQAGAAASLLGKFLRQEHGHDPGDAGVGGRRCDGLLLPGRDERAATHGGQRGGGIAGLLLRFRHALGRRLPSDAQPDEPRLRLLAAELPLQAGGQHGV